jgi:hypothetical protein
MGWRRPWPACSRQEELRKTSSTTITSAEQNAKEQQQEPHQAEPHQCHSRQETPFQSHRAWKRSPIS